MAFRLLTVAALALLCGCGGPPDGFTVEEWTAINELSPLPAVPPMPTNKYADIAAAATLGKKLFFEKRYSGALKAPNDGVNNGSLGIVGDTGRVGCVSCHDPTQDFTDTRSSPNNVSLGVTWTLRNSPSLVNVAFYDWNGWAGKQDSLWTQASLSPESGENTAGNRCGYAHMLWDFYRAEYDAVFDDDLPPALNTTATIPASCKPKKLPTDIDGPYENMTQMNRDAVDRIMANQGKAVAAYERQLVSRNAPFDQYVAGDNQAMSDSAKRGLRIFVGKGFCVQCHSGPFFTDQQFHNNGVVQGGVNAPATDEGRFTDLPAVLAHQFNTASVWSDDPASGSAKHATQAPVSNDDRGKFRTKALRGVALSAPYMHAGSQATLRDVVEHYNTGGAASGFSGVKDTRLQPLNLTDSEKDDLVAFLESLTGEELPAALMTP